MKRLILSALVIALGIFAFSSYASANEELSSQEATVVEVSNDEVVEPQWRALVNGAKYWGKEALKSFVDNGGLSIHSNEDLVSNSDLEEAFDN
ncbi:hypothetical protein [Virgibacillus chiguensis]|uniref:Uncharacterized protein n=1 Tax=Virgibacillus chiguensis TaxID=411959 RepID=A0A1M5XHE3_9BACI|nr:hypothetical protein [Virgibacillus chiguensis]SHH99196.1 hypothetical protein SAMN05421807_1275 [Virgibacillus chiguensis]